MQSSRSRGRVLGNGADRLGVSFFTLDASVRPLGRREGRTGVSHPRAFQPQRPDSVLWVSRPPSGLRPPGHQTPALLSGRSFASAWSERRLQVPSQAFHPAARGGFTVVCAPDPPGPPPGSLLISGCTCAPLSTQGHFPRPSQKSLFSPCIWGGLLHTPSFHHLFTPR